MTSTLQLGVYTEGDRAKWLKLLLVASMAAAAGGILSSVWQLQLLQGIAAGASVTDAEAAANDARHELIGKIQVGVYLITALVWLTWTHRAYANLTLMGTRQTRFTAGWAVGWWLVPLFNLFRGYQVTKELWLRSMRRNAMDAEKGRYHQEVCK